MRKTKSKVYYDRKTDVLWLNVQKGIEEEYKELTPGINIELNKNGEVLGIEILNASKVLGSKLETRSTRSSSSSAAAHKVL